jgi:hypothetical protein
LILLALAVYIGVQVLGVLYGIVLPPSPPLPNNVLELSHESAAYGVDRWEYSTTADPCEIVRFYEANDAVCLVARSQCGREGSDAIDGLALAYCSGKTPFSIFIMHWSAAVFPDEADSSRLEVNREIYWIGTGPAATPQFDLGQLSSSPNAPSAQ